MHSNKARDILRIGKLWTQWEGKKAVALVIEWDIFKPQLYDELLAFLRSAKDIPELWASINQFAPLIFMMIAKTRFVTDDLRAHRNSNMHDKRYSL